MYEALVARARYHIQKASFMGLKDAESTLLLGEAADAIEELWKKYVASEVDNTNLTGWLAEEHAKHLWIPVTERLPEHEYGESTSALTVDLYGVMRVTYFDGGNWCWPSGEALATTRVAPITHWMPLPEPPTEYEEE